MEMNENVVKSQKREVDKQSPRSSFYSMALNAVRSMLIANTPVQSKSGKIKTIRTGTPKKRTSRPVRKFHRQRKK